MGSKGGKKPELLVLGEESPKHRDLGRRSGGREEDASLSVSDLQTQPQASQESKDIQRCKGDEIGNQYNRPNLRPAMTRGPRRCHPSSHFQEVGRHVYQGYPHQYPFPYYQQHHLAPLPCRPFENYHQTTGCVFNQTHPYHVEQNFRPNPILDHRFRSETFIRRSSPNLHPYPGLTNNPHFYGPVPLVPGLPAVPYSPAASVGAWTSPFYASSTSHYQNFQGQHEMDRRASILYQVEYYFSDENLPSDHHLLSLLDKDGWVSIHSIASFRILNNLANNNTRLILDVLRSSNFIEIQGDKIRRRDWSKWIQASPHHATSSKSHATVDTSYLNHEESNNISVSNDFLSKSSPLEEKQRTPVTAEQSNLDQITFQKDCISCNNSTTDNNDGLDTLTQNLHNIKIVSQPLEDCKDRPCSGEDEN